MYTLFILYYILVKIKAVLDLIFCACDTDGDNRISQEEKDKEQCVAIQKSVFHGNYIDQGGFDFLRSVNNGGFQLLDLIITEL